MGRHTLFTEKFRPLLHVEGVAVDQASVHIKNDRPGAWRVLQFHFARSVRHLPFSLVWLG